MNRLLNTALLALAASLTAGLPTSGLPAGNQTAALHISNETVDKTKLGQALTAAFQAEVDANAAVATLKKELGFELDEDFRDLTVIGNVGDDNSLVALVRGKFNKARIEAFAASNNVPSRTVRGLKAWDIKALGDALAKAAGETPDASTPEKRAEVVIVDGNTLVIAPADGIDKAVAAATANTPWKHEGLSRAAASVQNGWLLISADVAAIEAQEAAKAKAVADGNGPAKKPSGLKVLSIALGENATDLTLRANAACVDDAAAKRNVSQAKGFLGFGAMLTLPGENDSPEQAAQKQELGDVIRRITVTQNGAAIDASLDYPVQKVAELILRQGERLSAKRAAPQGK